jgi:diadenosine tetraphosphatase ApaH/serine/threonine PP2A family protein phosphatase
MKKKYAVLGDIHSNLEALTVVLADAEQQGATGYVCVGDIVGYNANPAECLEKVRALGCSVARGNHDHYCAHDECLDDFHPLAANVIDWTRRQLTDEQIRYLQGLKYNLRVDGFTLVHSTLDMPEKWGYVFDALEADSHFNYQSTSVCFHGHTHVPLIFEKSGRSRRLEAQNMRLTLGMKYYVNVGSVGQPRDGNPQASYVLYDMEKRAIEFRRLPYDIAAAQAKIRKVGLPERLAKRLELGK